ncbi:MAG: ATP synthase F1 subunit gamma [Candidatus Moranbacteria bacterium]|nr:ATP synthase F1 subunit gamma [Candidatus Moranbacteria bacterium]
MSNTKELKARLKSIRNTRKITKAMEMVAASKMKKVINRAIRTREYTQTAWEILTKISESVDKIHPLLMIRPVKKVCLIVFTSNKGLCGGLNNQLLRKVNTNLKNPYNLLINRTHDRKILPKIDPKQAVFEIVTVGKKGEEEMIRLNRNLIAVFNDFNEQSTLSNLKPVAKMAIDGYVAKKYDKVVIAYTDFISTVSNKPRLRQVLPVSRKDLERQLEELGRGVSEEQEMEELKAEVEERYYTFEPNKEKILEMILPKVVESQIYQAFLESQAAEFSARMLTMKNASDTAMDMIKSFEFQYNQARQAAITSELAEISAGMAVLND